jgi:hypothetical protein
MVMKFGGKNVWLQSLVANVWLVAKNPSLIAKIKNEISGFYTVVAKNQSRLKFPDFCWEKIS